MRNSIRRELRSGEQIPRHGDSGGPLVGGVMWYEDGTEIRVGKEKLQPLFGGEDEKLD